MTELIQLPVGTDHRGLHLKPPHGELIADGYKTQIAKAKPFDLSGPWILISGGKAWGTMEVGLPEPIDVEGFDKAFGEHRVSVTERKKWWTGKETLYLSEITAFEPFKKTLDIQVIPGMQTVIETVEFITAEPDLLEHCEQVRLVIGSTEKETTGDTTWIEAEEKAEANMETEEKAAGTEGAEGAPTAEAIEIGSKPYDPKDPPAKVRGMPEKAQRIWVHAYNSALEKYPDDEARCHKIAYGAVKNAGYYQDKDGAWHAPKEKKEMDEGQKELGEGQGVDGPRQGVGGAEVCRCPSCGYEMEHERGTPCAEIKCPKCGAAMQGQPQESKATWDTAYVNSLGDGCFLHIEAGGDKDETGRTKPRSLRHLPYKNQANEIDLPHLRNAISRLGQPKTGKGWLTEDLRKRLLAKARGILAKQNKTDSKNVLVWLKEKFDGILDGLREPPELGMTFKAIDGRTWLLTWTTNAFQDREEETFRTKAIEDYVARHADDETKGEFWFWHLPGAKMAQIEWQAVVGRFLVEAGPFDDTPTGRKMAEFFSQHPHDHPEIAPEGWGTSHGFKYVDADRADKIYDWFDKFETTVLPKSAASNQHSPKMEVLPMNQQQKDALTAIAGDEFVNMVIKTGEERTKELEERGIAFKETEEVAEEVETEEVAEVKEAEEATETEEVEETEVKETDSQMTALAQQIVAGLNLGTMTEAIKSIQDTVKAIAGSQVEQDKRLKALEDIGGEQSAPLIPLPRATYWQASRVAQTEPDEKLADKAQPKVPDAISEMAKRIPI